VQRQPSGSAPDGHLSHPQAGTAPILQGNSTDSLHEMCSSERLPHGLTVSEPARDRTLNKATENAALSYITHPNGFVHTPPPTVWAGDCEIALNPGAIDAKNSLIINSRIEECRSPSASHLDSQFLPSPLAMWT
jgi:hypothetical protein